MMTARHNTISTLRIIAVLGMISMVSGSLCASSAAEGAPFWPQYHGPNRDAISTETGFMTEWSEEGPELLWTATGLGHGFATVSIADGRMYTAGNIDGSTVVTALDLDGKILWQTINGKAWDFKPAYPGARGTPTIDGDFVYHENPHGNVICLDAKTGEVKWEVNTLETYNSENIQWALAESLLVDGDNVISSPGGPEVSLVALNKTTGEVVWKAPSVDNGAGYGSPILFEQSGLRIITTLTSKSLIGVDADSGELLWKMDHESYTDQNTLTPIYHDGHLFISTIRADSIKWKVKVADGMVMLQEVWRTEQFDNHHGGVTLVNGNLYGSSISKNRNKWVSLDWETGEIESAGEGIGKASAMVAEGLMYVLSIDRRVGLMKPTDTDYELISSFEIPEGGDGKSWAHPVVTGGRLHIRHSDFLYVYDVSAE
jgi:hypothetical protein